MANWMWYPGDFEIYHGMCQNFSREERGFFWPAFWKIDDCRHMVKFWREFRIREKTTFTVYARGMGYVALCEVEEKEAGAFHDELKFPFGREVICTPGKYRIEIIVGNKSGLPCAFVDGKEIFSGEGWTVSDLADTPQEAGWNTWYTSKEQNPMEIAYKSQMIKVCAEEVANGGVLLDFGKEMTAETLVEFLDNQNTLTLCYGESREEALDTEWCYLKQQIVLGEEDSDFGKWESARVYRTKIRAFRYIFIPNEKPGQVSVQADFRYIEFPQKSSFGSSDQMLEKIWNVAEYTFRLASGAFFIDGIKRDRWIWSGDAYQCYFINQYLLADCEISKRTMLALRGNDPVCQHINTIVDYSLYWIMGIADHYALYGDEKFIRFIYPKMESLMEYCIRQTDEHGFLYGRKEDWIFIDWSDIDVGDDKLICEEQMLLLRSYQSMSQVQKLLGINTEKYEQLFESLRKNVEKFFWDEEKGAYIDSFTTGKRKVSRHSNIFAVLFDYVSEEQKISILKNVLKNPAITPITTPYFKFWELEAFAKLGEYEYVLVQMKRYWGGMLRQGATTFWEEYVPEKEIPEQYSMYRDRFGKSLCHAWGAGPVYLLSRYFFGLYPETPEYEQFVIEPHVELLEDFDVTLPAGDGNVRISRRNNCLKIMADKEGGRVVYEGKNYALTAGKALELEITL